MEIDYSAQTEAFRQFVGAHLERQTAAAEQQARHVNTLLAIVVVWVALSVLGAVALLVGALR